MLTGELFRIFHSYNYLPFMQRISIIVLWRSIQTVAPIGHTNQKKKWVINNYIKDYPSIIHTRAFSSISKIYYRNVTQFTPKEIYK